MYLSISDKAQPKRRPDSEPESSSSLASRAKKPRPLRSVRVHPSFPCRCPVRAGSPATGSLFSKSQGQYRAKRRVFAAVLITTTVRRRFGPGHTTRAPPVGFELATNDIQSMSLPTTQILRGKSDGLPGLDICGVSLAVNGTLKRSGVLGITSDVGPRDLYNTTLRLTQF